MKLSAPFPYFGGKSKVADIVWERFGNVKNYVEPFIGSAAVLLRRPAKHLEQQMCIETINDVDGMVANFWRSITQFPDEVAAWCDWPVNENDLHARHKWLVGQKESLVKKLEADPEYCDPKIAGWWVWGMSIWIGGGFCKELSRQKPILSGDRDLHRKRPDLDTGRGIKRLKRELPRLARPVGTHRHKLMLSRPKGIHRKLPRIDRAAGVGVNKRGARRLHLGRSYDLQSQAYSVRDDFGLLAERLRRVRTVCGDWKRVTSPTATTYHNGITGVFLDPPYPHRERDKGLYAHEQDIFEEVWTYAMANGNNPKIRIAICGYEDGRAPLKGWTTYRWKTSGGYGRISKKETRAAQNAKREVIWFSPHCLAGARTLFDEAAA